jgi:hypothetical protein
MTTETAPPKTKKPELNSHVSWLASLHRYQPQQFQKLITNLEALEINLLL